MRTNDVLNLIAEVEYLLFGPISKAEHELFRDEAMAWTGFPSPRPVTPEERRKQRAGEKLRELYDFVGKEGVQRVRLPEDFPFERIRLPKEDGEPEFLDSYADRWEFRLLRNKRLYSATYHVTREVQPEAIPYAMDEILRSLIEEIKKIERP